MTDTNNSVPLKPALTDEPVTGVVDKFLDYAKHFAEAYKWYIEAKAAATAEEEIPGFPYEMAILHMKQWADSMRFWSGKITEVNARADDLEYDMVLMLCQRDMQPSAEQEKQKETSE